MRRIACSILALSAIAVVFGSGWPASAEEQPPARVGRVSVVAGQLGFHVKGETKWSAAAVNYPVATGGSFWTDPKSRAEIRIGAQSIALSNDTQIDVTRLDKQVMQIAVPQGRIELHVRQLGDGNSVEIDIPRGGVWLLQPGVYDINAGTPDRPARIMVFEGSARFVGGGLDSAIKAGEAAVISGTDTLTATIERAAPDAFVQWCRARDYREQRLASPYYVSPRMTGYEELDAYGSWRSAPDYGEVWYPRAVPAGWAPYRYGHWAWIEPWGWTWVDNEPWGFAPSHYGRWAYLDGGWGWIPGGYINYPVYAPALVAFLADPGALLARGRGGSYVGWFPLGPGETATGNTAFANRRATTVVAQQTFAGTGPVARAALPVSGAAVQTAAVTARAPAPAAARAGAATAPGTLAGAATTGTSAAAAGRLGGAAATGAIAGAAAGRLSASGRNAVGRTGAGSATTGIAGSGAAGAVPARSAARGGSRFAAPMRGAAGARFGAGGLAASSARTSRFAGTRFAPAAASRGAASRFAAPRAAPMAAFHGGGPRFGGGGGPHFSGGGSHFSGGGGGPRFGGGGIPHGGGGGGPHFSGGGIPHGGGGPHFSGGGAPHGGGGGAPHGNGKGHG